MGRHLSLTDAQIEQRRSGIGGSEIAAVVGMSPFASPMQVWLEKVHGERREQNDRMRLGVLLEPVVLALYVDETGAELTLAESLGTLQHPTVRHALATPDAIALVDGERRLVEAKACAWRKRGEWGEPGTDEVPPHYLLQVQWTMAVAGLERADVAVLFGGEKLERYEVRADPELQEWLIAESGRWWVRHVDGREPPPIDGSEAATRWLQRIEHKRPALLEATPAALEWAQVHRRAKAAAKVAKADAELAGNQLRALIGEDEGIQGERWRATWKADKRGRRTLRVTWMDDDNGEGADE